MGLWVEIATVPKNRNANLKPAKNMGDYIGFRSVYLWDDEDAGIIRQNMSSRGFKYLDPISNCLFVDIDMKSHEDVSKAKEEIKRLSEKGLRFDLYHSGSRSYHLHIPHEMIQSKDLPYTHSQTVQELGITCDHSIYRPSSLFRLPGTVHSKTLKTKKLIKSFEGRLLEIELRETPVKSAGGFKDSGSLPADALFSTLWDNCLEQPPERYLKLFSLACAMFDGGLSSQAVLECLQLVNNSWPEPNEESEVLRALYGAEARLRE